MPLAGDDLLTPPRGCSGFWRPDAGYLDCNSITPVRDAPSRRAVNWVIGELNIPTQPASCWQAST
jgi:hypothetical protein